MFAEIPADKLAYIVPLLVLPILPNLWGIWHVSKSAFRNTQERALWMVALIFLPVLGGLGYMLFGIRRINKNKKLHGPE